MSITQKKDGQKSTFAKMALLSAVGSVALLSGCVMDDTDLSASTRSGMVLVVDTQTGCQYLAKNRDITPRLTESKKLFCGSTQTAEELEGADRGHISVDYGTGCEYISVSYGYGLTPRLDKNGEASCNPALKRTAKLR